MTGAHHSERFSKGKVASDCSRLVACLLLSLGLAMTSACASRPQSQTWPEPFPTKVGLMPGDEVEVRFRYWPELDENQAVRSDGKMSLQLVDEVPVMGLTPEELDKKLSALYEAHLVNPDLTVIVRRLENQRVFVAGAVGSPGSIPMPGRLTLLQALMEAGGFDPETGAPSKAIVIRHDESGKQYARVFDLKSPLFKLAESQADYLAPNDIVYVPQTKITKINQFVDQYINRVVPDIVSDVVLYYALDQSSENNN